MKHFKKLGVLCALAFALCGCFKMNVNIDVTKDGDAALSMDFLMQETLLEYTGQSVDDLEKSFKEGYGENADQLDFKKIEETIDDEKYTGFRMNAPKSETGGLKNNITVKDDTVTIKISKTEIDQLTGGVGNLGESGLGEETDMSMEDMKAQGMEYNLNISMPGKVKSASVGEIDGKTVKVDLLAVEEGVEVVCELGNDNTTLYIVGGIAAVVIIGGIVIFMKKRNKKDDVTSEEATIKTETTEETVAEETVVEETTTEENEEK